MIRLSPLDLGAEEEANVLAVLRSGRLAQGPMVEAFEERFRSIAGTAHAVAVGSGTAALVAALQALDLEPGDEVVTSPFTFAATLNAILEAGAVARFVDVGEDATMDPDALEAVVGPLTRAVMPVHLYGLPSDMVRIGRIAAEAGLVVVEDAAQAHGATVDGKPVGSFGIGCFSFYATKNVTTGEGGIVTTDDDDVADRIRLLRNQGMRARYQYEIPGHNYRMTELQAAVGLPQLERLAERNRRRRNNAEMLDGLLEGIPGLVLPVTPGGREHVYHQYTVRVTGEAVRDRDGLRAGLAERGVESGVYYPRVVFDYPCYREHDSVAITNVPNAERAALEVLSLPVHPGLSDEDLHLVAAHVRDLLGA